MRLADTPERIRADALAVSRQGVDVGLRLSVICRPTRTEAREAANSLISDLDTREREKEFIGSTDSTSIKATYERSEAGWLTPTFWAGAVPYIGPTAVALVGTPEDIANAIMEYKGAGVSQFILSGWPKLDEMIRFGREILPLIRGKEALSKGKYLSRSASKN
jgi:alkanesulfonate monooxygenase